MRPLPLPFLLVPLLGCSGDAASGTTTDTDSGGSSGTSTCPQCSGIRDECVPVGTCTFEGSAFGAPGSRDCWDGGVVQVHEGGVTTVTKDGEPCHSWETSGMSSTFYAADGTVAGTMTFNLSTMGVTIECDGQTWEITQEDVCPSWFPDGVDCLEGSCPAP